MNAQTRKTRIVLIAALLVAAALVASGCSVGNARLGTIDRVVDITIDQAQFDQRGPHFTVGLNGPYDRLLDQVTRVEIHDGFLRYTGFKTQPNGLNVPGSFDLSVGAEDGALKAQIIAVSIPGVTLADPAIVEANRRLAAELGQMATGADADVRFLDVTAREGSLYIRVSVHVDL
jgi:hypothetical protein